MGVIAVFACLFIEWVVIGIEETAFKYVLRPYVS